MALIKKTTCILSQEQIGESNTSSPIEKTVRYYFLGMLVFTSTIKQQQN